MDRLVRSMRIFLPWRASVVIGEKRRIRGFAILKEFRVWRGFCNEFCGLTRLRKYGVHPGAGSAQASSVMYVCFDVISTTACMYVCIDPLPRRPNHVE